MATITDLERKLAALEKEVADLRAARGGIVHKLDDWERSEVRKGILDSYATDAEVQRVFAKYGLPSTI